jgi:hypothetical protein
MQLATASAQWTALQPSTIAGDFDFPMQAPFMAGERGRSSPSAGAPVEVAMASLNVLTMRQVGAYVSFAKQMHQFGLTVVGVQEARPPAQGVHVISSDEYKYLVLSGSATPRGTHGCQLWIDMKANWLQGNLQHSISRDQTCILQYSPRHPFVRIRT